MLNNEYGVTLAEKEVIEVTLNEQLPGTDGNGIASIVAVPVAGGQNVTINYTYPGMDPVVLFIPNGEQGVTGNGIENIVVTPDEGGNTITINFTDGVTEPVSFSVADGTDGVSITSITKVDTVGLVDTYEIVYSTGSRSYFYVTNGADGYTPIKGVDYFDGDTPVKGVDYFDGEDNVYVGATEPTDPETKVWIDTDADPQTVINDGVTSLDRTWSSTKITTAMQGKTITDAGGYFGTDTVEGALAELGVERTKILSDLTFNAAWKTGTASVDSATNIITLAGHKFADNQPIEFGAGTGALPNGISAYNVDTKGGEYYYVISATTDTFKISLTRAGAEVDIKDAGTSGWQVRLAYVTFLTCPMTIANTDYKKIRMLISGSVVSADATIFAVYGFYVTSANRQIFRNGTQWGNVMDVSLMTSTNTNINKYNIVNHIIELDMVGGDAFITSNEKVLHTSDKSTGALITDTSKGSMMRFTSLTALYLASNNTATKGLRNGTRILILGVN